MENNPQMSSMRAGCGLCLAFLVLDRCFKFPSLTVTQARHSTALTTCRHFECQHTPAANGGRATPGRRRGRHPAAHAVAIHDAVPANSDWPLMFCGNSGTSKSQPP